MEEDSLATRFASGVAAGLDAVQSTIFPLGAFCFLCLYPVSLIFGPYLIFGQADAADAAASKADSRRRLSSDVAALAASAALAAACWPFSKLAAAALALCTASAFLRPAGAATAARWARLLVLVSWMAVRLAAFSALLLPGLLRVVFRCISDARIRRGVRYGPGPRQFVDIYVPAEAAEAVEKGAPPVPVVVAVMGGAFVIGHRAWNAQLGMRLADAGVLCLAVDYRNFPQARVPDMVNDIEAAISWAIENVAAFGGDAARIALFAQSAGAHLAAQTILERSLREAQRAEAGEVLAHGWSPLDLRAFVGVSGPYDFLAMEPHLEAQGLSRDLLHAICGCSADVPRCSPVSVLSGDDWQAVGEEAAARLPPILLFHGALDKAVPVAQTERFAEALKRGGAAHVTVDVRQGMTHTDPVVEMPLRGQDVQVALVLPFLLGEAGAEARLRSMPALPRLSSDWAARLASRASPF